jgi:TPR repeat protein
MSVVVRLSLLATLAAVAAPAAAQTAFDPQWGHLCRAQDGWVCVRDDRVVCVVARDGSVRELGEEKIPAPKGAAPANDDAPASEFLDSYVLGLVGTSRGFAVAVVDGCAWHGDGPATYCTTLQRVRLAVAEDRVLAGGTTTVDGVDMLAVASVGDDGAWTTLRTGLTNAALLGFTRVGGRWYVHAGRNDAGPDRADLDPTEVWTSTDGAQWTRCTLPDAMRQSPLQWESAFTAFDGAVVGVVRDTVLRSTGPTAFEAIHRANPLCHTPGGTLHVVGDTLYEVESNHLHATTDLRRWTTRKSLPRNGATTPPAKLGLRDGAFVTLMRDPANGQLVERGLDAVLSPAVYGMPLPTPTARTQVELPGVRCIAPPVWTGSSLTLASDLGLHESVDGAQWPLVTPGWRDATVGVGLDALPFGERMLLWLRGERLDANARALRFGANGAFSGRSKNDFVAKLVATDGATLACVTGPGERNDAKTPWLLHVSRDDGATWTSSPCPPMAPETMTHGALGWCLAGTELANAKGVIALSADLATWRIAQPIPHHPRVDSVVMLGDRLVAAASMPQPGYDEGTSIATSADGVQWSALTLVGGRTHQLAAKLQLVEGQAWLQAIDDTYASLDGTTWHRMGKDILPAGAERIVAREGTWFVRCETDVQLAGGGWAKKSTLWRQPAVTAAQIAAAPAATAAPYQLLTPGLAWMKEAAAADEAMTLATKQSARNAAVDKAGKAWRAAHADRPIEEAIREATAWHQRLLDYQTDDDSVYDAFLAAQSFFDQKGFQAFLATRPKNLRDYLRDRSQAVLKGTPRTLKITQTSANPPKPQKQSAWFDVTTWRRAAANGSVGAMIDLSRAYANGAGVPDDAAANRFWAAQAKARGFELPARWTPEEDARAAAVGSWVAKWDRAVARADAKARDYDPQAAIAQLRAVAEAGVIPAMFDASKMLYDRSQSEAAEGFCFAQRAAASGDANALCWLGMLLELGAGVERDLPQAIAQYRRAAALGDRRAMQLLGELLYEGKGAPADTTEGMRLLVEAAKLGDETAPGLVQTFRDRKLHVCSRPLRRDVAVRRSRQFDIEARRAQAQGGDAAACYDLMCAYEDGLGVDSDWRWAEHWRQRVRDAGGDPFGAKSAWADRGSIVAVLQNVRANDYLIGDEETRLATLRQAAKVNLEAAHDAANLARSLARTADELLAANAELERNAKAGHAGSLVRLGQLQYAGDGGVIQEPDVAHANWLRAAALGSRDGAWRAAYVGGEFGADPDQRMALYLQAARMTPDADFATGDDASRRAARARQAQRILDAATAGDGAALHVAAAMMLQPPADTVAASPRQAAAYAWAAQDLRMQLWDNDPLPTEELALAAVGPLDLTALNGSLVAFEIAERLDRQLGRDDWSKRLAASAPERSRLKQAVAELLDGKLDGMLQLDERLIEEALGGFDFRAIREAAGKHPGKRGEELLCALAGVEPGDRERYARTLLAKSGDFDVYVVRDALRRIETIRQWYGIGCAADPVEALSWHLVVDGEQRWRGVKLMGGTLDQWSKHGVRLRQLRAMGQESR